MRSRSLGIGIFLAIITILAVSCKRDQQEDIVPSVPVNIRINLELPLYFNLQFPGNYVNLTGGNKGIVLLHGFDGEYYALDRTCTHDPFLDCSRVEIDESLSFRCGSFFQGEFEACCSSRFQFDGAVTEGPALYPLRRYNVIQTGNILDIIN